MGVGRSEGAKLSEPAETERRRAPFPIIDIPLLEIETQPMKVEVEREQDGRWIAEVPVISGAMAYGATRDEAVSKVEALVLRILADRLEHGEPSPEVSEVFSLAA